MDVQPHLETLTKMVLELAAEKGMTILGAIVILVVGWKIVNSLVGVLDRSFKRFDVDPLIGSFLNSFALWTLRVMLFLSIAAMLGVQTTSFLAVLGSAGLAIGLALQGSLSNLAGGVMILLVKPFKIGDFIETSSHSGTVKRIQLFHTHLNTIDNRLVIIPNGTLAGSSLINYSAESTRRIDLNIGISYSDDIKKAKQLLMSLVENDEKVLADPAPQVFVSGLGESEVSLRLRIWVLSEDFWPMTYHLTEEAKLLFDREGVTIPFPQRDVHLHQVQ